MLMNEIFKTKFVSLLSDTSVVANDMLIWGRPGYQTMMTGASDPVSFFVKIKTETYGTGKIVKTSEDGMKLMATDTFKGWDADLANNGICGLCYNYYDGARSFMGHKAYNTPADLKGAVIRTPGADPYVESISAMGATPYNIAWSEVYNGIQTKSIDGCEVQYTSAVSSKIYEVCEYVSKTEHINLFNMVICGQAWFDKLPAEYQEVMKKDFNDCAYNNAQDIIAAQDDMEKTLTDNGMTIVEVDKDIFREAVKPAYEKLGWTELREQLYKEAGVEA